MIKTLSRRRHGLADPEAQLTILDQLDGSAIPRFEDDLRQSELFPFRPGTIDTLQVNIGKVCNQTCGHCHVDAGPDRKEVMPEEIIEACIAALRTGRFSILDITGGAPELHPEFRDFVRRARPHVDRLIVRSNLTIIVSAERFRDLPDFFRANRIEVVSSLPFYSRSRTDAQRGEGVFDASIEALLLLNEAGYGQEGSGLHLHLVYNPTGYFLPGDQNALEREYKKRLQSEFGVVFNDLYTITNMPISRFLESLVRTGHLESYMERLASAYNPAAAESAMCRNLISVGWDGSLYDCDFNQMLELNMEGYGNITDVDLDALGRRNIVTGRHCYGCTAGSGSSCGGATV